MELNNWALIEVNVVLPFGPDKLYYLVYIHKFNSVWTVELVFNLSQRKLVSPRIAEKYIDELEYTFSKYRKHASGYEYLLNTFDKDTIYFIKSYINPNLDPDQVKIIDKFSYQISEKAIEKINYFLTQLV